MNSIDVPNTATPSTSPPVAADVRAVCHATWNPEGRPSKIHEYCNDTVRKGQNCMWFVRRYGRSTFASDVVVEDIEKGSNPFKLRCFDSWWSRFGFYNIVGVRHVKIKFPASEKGKRGFPVIAKIVNHADDVANEYASFENLEIHGDPWACGPDATGVRHAPNFKCANAILDEVGNVIGCRVHRRRVAKKSLEAFEWTPTLLDHYWKHGIQGAGTEFLKNGNFLVSYSHLAEDSYEDAEDPYGKSVDAFELVRDWRVRRLLWTILAAIMADICIFAIVILLTGSGETGLAAGSYAAAIEALLIALLTLLSALVQ